MTWGAGALALLCAALWGGLAVAVRFTQEDLPPVGTAALRFGIASVVVALWGKSQGQGLWVRREEWKPISVVGILLFLQIGLFHWGLTQTNSAHGSVLIGSNPVFVALIAHFMLLGDRLSWGKLAGLGLAVLGLVTVFAGPSGVTSGDPPTWLGDGIILLSSLL